ncbi:NADH dehydrogenase [ubiquinone] 1 beta subcomplex subunit 4 [Daktulosphaira vitifoliae]|uniref:NADH dehydrogenase [ubiquinone] 1 beta subcomplex subunit 4 n=1 Tax=Daktulosphaira vitifoliae TaxID=58002 RepID=UPI0021AA402F|nr:NADH dehydrogenase [ubiquinone] 1 beta subcomplex subunit 4 [Daktulosphaira vitifoliae]
MAHASPYKVITDPEIIRKKNEMRKAVTQEYIKNLTNPHRNMKMEGGFMFDAGIQRYMSLKATQHEFFRPTPKTSLLGFLFIVVPFGTLTYFIKKERDRRENLIRTGQIAYKDRGFKFAS